MGCGCKGESTKKIVNEENGVKKSLNIVEIFQRIGGGIAAVLIATLLLPVMWFTIAVAMYRSWFHGAFDLSSVLKKLKKESKIEADEEEEINPEDYELVGVDKV
jgi:hypothetical protein